MNRRGFLKALVAAPLAPVAANASALIGPPLLWHERARLAISAGLMLQACLILRGALLGPEGAAVRRSKEFVYLGVDVAPWLREHDAEFEAATKEAA